MKKIIAFTMALCLSFFALAEEKEKEPYVPENQLAFGVYGSMIVGNGFAHSFNTSVFESSTPKENDINFLSNDFGLGIDCLFRHFFIPQFAFSARVGLDSMSIPIMWGIFSASLPFWKVAIAIFPEIPPLGAMGSVFVGALALLIDLAIPIVTVLTADSEVNLEYHPYKNSIFDTFLSFGPSVFHLMPNIQLKAGINCKAGHFLFSTDCGYRLCFLDIINKDNFNIATDGHKFVANVGLRYCF